MRKGEIYVGERICTIRPYERRYGGSANPRNRELGTLQIPAGSVWTIVRILNQSVIGNDLIVSFDAIPDAKLSCGFGAAYGHFISSANLEVYEDFIVEDDEVFLELIGCVVHG